MDRDIISLKASNSESAELIDRLERERMILEETVSILETELQVPRETITVEFPSLKYSLNSIKALEQALDKVADITGGYTLILGAQVEQRKAALEAFTRIYSPLVDPNP